MFSSRTLDSEPQNEHAGGTSDQLAHSITFSFPALTIPSCREQDLATVCDSAGVGDGQRFRDTFFSRSGRYSLGRDGQTGSDYLSVPVTNGPVDYEEYYRLSAEEYAAFSADPAAALAFADECRKGRQDRRLLQQPGTNRGIAT